MKKAAILILAALMIPAGVALAAKPSHAAKPVPQANYEFKGTLSNYSAYNAVGPVMGSITIVVSDTNAEAKALKGMTLTFPVGATTHVELKDGLVTITNGDDGSVTVRAAKNIAPAVLAATLQATAAAKINDHGVKKVPMVTYVLKGTLSNYSAYNSVGPVNGSITIMVQHGNKPCKSLKGMTLTFAVDASTTISLHDGVVAIVNGDRGIVKIRAAKMPKNTSAADLAIALQAVAAKQIVDQGVKK